MDLAALRAEVLAIWRAGVAAVEPANSVARALPEALRSVATYRNVEVLAVGKAAAAMARGAAQVLGERVAGGLVVTKDGHGAGAPPALALREAGHPVPDARSLAAGEELLERARLADPRDLVLVLVSGGASALAEALVPGVTLAELQARTDALLRSGAPIAQVNAARRALSRLKAGGLARARRGGMLALCLSDVPGDDPAVIGSGLAWTGAEGVPHVVVASVAHAVNAAAAEAAGRGFHVLTVADRLEGEAREAHTLFLDWLDAAPAAAGTRRLVIAGGETVVHVRGAGRGGRNQELALAAVPALEGRPGTVLAALGTDGTDGPTDAAGGIVDSESAGRARGAGVDVRRALAANDAYVALERIGDLVRTGATGTNVGDLVVAARVG